MDASKKINSDQSTNEQPKLFENVDELSSQSGETKEISNSKPDGMIPELFDRLPEFGDFGDLCLSHSDAFGELCDAWDYEHLKSQTNTVKFLAYFNYTLNGVLEVLSSMKTEIAEELVKITGDKDFYD